VALSYDHDLYFKFTSRTQVVPLEALRPTKALTSQRASIARAEELMREAASGTRPRRTPLTVRWEQDGLAVLDGNATFGVAVNNQWPDVPVEVQESPGK